MRDKQYWRYNDNLYHVDFQYPKLVTQSWNGVPTTINTALTWKDSLYFFKGNHYYRYNISRTIEEPSPIGQFWKGVPGNIDAAFRYV